MTYIKLNLMKILEMKVAQDKDALDIEVSRQKQDKDIHVKHGHHSIRIPIVSILLIHQKHKITVAIPRTQEIQYGALQQI